MIDEVFHLKWIQVLDKDFMIERVDHLGFNKDNQFQFLVYAKKRIEDEYQVKRIDN